MFQYIVTNIKLICEAWRFACLRLETAPSEREDEEFETTLADDVEQEDPNGEFALFWKG